jgi:hypothetical protein
LFIEKAVWRTNVALAIPRSVIRELKGRVRPRRRPRPRNRVKVGFFENEDENEEDFVARTTLHACRKAISRYNVFRLWRKTSRQTKTA